uniref:Uncharacterized protein MLC1351.26c n=1 Tax=Mycobacterium leprae TaxID=1769 RepID=O05687_MYCLR|nr:hypothetical protein MLC1351.26c [Mycobacterium leprae]
MQLLHLSKDHSTDVITAAMINHKTTPYHRIAVQPQRETKTSKRLSYPHHHGIDTDLCDLTHRPANTLTHHPLLHPHTCRSDHLSVFAIQLDVKASVGS